MKLNEIVKKLDEEFSVQKTGEDLVEWAVNEKSISLISPYFLEKKTGLMLKGSETIEKVYTSVFVTDQIVYKLSKQDSPCLIFTHHNFDYHEDARGLQDIPVNNLQILREMGHSLFVAHASLDTHKEFGTSVSLAELVGIEIDELFYEYYGAPVALVGHIKRETFDNYTDLVKSRLQRPYLTQIKNQDYVENVGVVAGGGDDPQILQKVNDFGCDTYLTGTVEHRWSSPHFQKLNHEFHELNKQLKINLIGGTHYGTERPAMIKVLRYFQRNEIPAEYCEDDVLLNIE
jgi:putative NIF3 family GTP cyclohydrolase 1 type 2